MESSTYLITPKREFKRNGIVLTPEMQILVTTPEKSPFSNVAKAVVDEYNRVWNFDYLSANANRQWFTVECISRFYSIECSMEKLRERLQMLEEIIFLQNHIHECIDIVWTANDKDHAAKLLKEKFGLSMAVYLDERISNLTESHRSVIRDEVAELKDYIERLKSKIVPYIKIYKIYNESHTSLVG